MKTNIHTFDDYEVRVFGFRQAILKMAADDNADSDVVAAALADVLGIAAATLDRVAGSQTLPDRLDAFSARVEQTYTRMRNLPDGTHTR